MTERMDGSTNGGTRANGDIDRIVGLLTKPERRELLRALQGTDRCVAIDEVNDQLTWGSDSNDRLWLLHHVHLPKLEAAGLAEFDRHHGTIQYFGNQLVTDVLEAVASMDGLD